MDGDLQYGLGEEIITEIERYRTLVEATVANNDSEALTTTLDQFLAAANPFIYLYGEYDYYTVLADFVEGYYLGGSAEKAQNLSSKIIDELNNRLELFSQFSEENQMRLVDRIKNEILEYQYLLDIIEENDSSYFGKEAKDGFEKAIDLFTAKTETTPED